MISDLVKRFPRPRNRWLRRLLGVALVIGGLLWFLPILGLWMLPLGLIVLSDDIPWLRRRRRRMQVWWERRRQRAATPPAAKD